MIGTAPVPWFGGIWGLGLVNRSHMLVLKLWLWLGDRQDKCRPIHFMQQSFSYFHPISLPWGHGPAPVGNFNQKTVQCHDRLQQFQNNCLESGRGFFQFLFLIRAGPESHLSVCLLLASPEARLAAVYKVRITDPALLAQRGQGEHQSRGRKWDKKLKLHRMNLTESFNTR